MFSNHLPKEVAQSRKSITYLRVTYLYPNTPTPTSKNSGSFIQKETDCFTRAKQRSPP